MKPESLDNNTSKENLMLNPGDFNKPTAHPFGMCQSYRNASEKEQTLAWMLIKCIEAGNWIEIKTQDSLDSMVRDGLVVHSKDNHYSLSQLAKGLLYGHYGKIDAS